MPLQQVRPVGQTRPQALQLFSSVLRSTQVPLQHVWPSAQRLPQAPQLNGLVPGMMQRPPQQMLPAIQGRPHLPQFASSVCVLTHRLPQRVSAGRQAHVPFVVLQKPEQQSALTSQDSPNAAHCAAAFFAPTAPSTPASAVPANPFSTRRREAPPAVSARVSSSNRCPSILTSLLGRRCPGSPSPTERARRALPSRSAATAIKVPAWTHPAQPSPSAPMLPDFAQPHKRPRFMTSSSGALCRGDPGGSPGHKPTGSTRRTGLQGDGDRAADRDERQ